VFYIVRDTVYPILFKSCRGVENRPESPERQNFRLQGELLHHSPSSTRWTALTSEQQVKRGPRLYRNVEDCWICVSPMHRNEHKDVRLTLESSESSNRFVYPYTSASPANTIIRCRK
jgi:hypothetical protein